MATHSSVAAWRVPWTEEPGGLQSTGLQKSDMTEATACMYVCMYVYGAVVQIKQEAYSFAQNRS